MSFILFIINSVKFKRDSSNTNIVRFTCTSTIQKLVSRTKYSNILSTPMLSIKSLFRHKRYSIARWTANNTYNGSQYHLHLYGFNLCLLNNIKQSINGPHLYVTRTLQVLRYIISCTLLFYIKQVKLKSTYNWHILLLFKIISSTKYFPNT